MSIQTIITADPDGQELVKQAELLGNSLVRGNVTRSQMRSIFSEARQIEASWGKRNTALRLSMLKPKLAYQKARQNRDSEQAFGGLVSDLSAGIDVVLDPKVSVEERDKRFTKLMNYFEAVLAYHRAAGGR
ncbi:MAG: type III-A CRISPR-associated protein Csm2 [Leptolinea sp.]|jgi:CRISPR-associated protein Csm2|nr:type III-A CRISPR-associated protein Csm2 [Leptolinea sp.]